jgi:hypothetical protein
MLKAAERSEIFCVHDIHAKGGLTEMYDYWQHRELFANIAKRSRYFVVVGAKVGVRGETGGQVEIGYRYFEGTAAGAVMIGEALDCDRTGNYSGGRKLLSRSNPTDPTRWPFFVSLVPSRNVTAISRRHTKGALLRHNWIHRWNEMFRIVGIKPSPRRAARERRLTDLADLCTSAGQRLNWAYSTVDSPNEA